MCCCSSLAKYCAITKICRKSELIELEIGISIRRYFPPKQTAGLEWWIVSGWSRVPCPPAKMTVATCTGFLGIIPHHKTTRILPQARDRNNQKRTADGRAAPPPHAQGATAALAIDRPSASLARARRSAYIRTVLRGCAALLLCRA